VGLPVRRREDTRMKSRDPRTVRARCLRLVGKIFRDLEILALGARVGTTVDAATLLSERLQRHLHQLKAELEATL
jgi:hypothetical protein